MFWFFLCCMKIVKFLAFSKHWTVPSIFSTLQCSVQIWSFSQLSILALLAFFAKGILIQPVFVFVYVIVSVFALICELVHFWRHISYARWASVTHTIYRAYFTHKHRIFHSQKQKTSLTNTEYFCHKPRIFHSQKQNTSLSNTEYFTHRMFVYTRLMKQSNTHFANTKHNQSLMKLASKEQKPIDYKNRIRGSFKTQKLVATHNSLFSETNLRIF